MAGKFYGYGSLPKAALHQMPEILPGVRNCVMGLADVQPGENVVIIAEETSDPVVVEAFRTVASMIDGVDVTTVYCKPFSPAGIDPDNPSDAVVQAYAAADTAFILSWYPDNHSRKLPGAACKIYDTKSVSLYQLASFDMLSSPAARFPLPVMYLIMKKMRDMVAGKLMRITDERGTDMLVRCPDNVLEIFGGIRGYPPRPLTKGRRAHFPPSTTGFIPTEADGVFWPVESTIIGNIAGDVKVTVEGGYMTNIEGGRAAEALLSFLNGPGTVPGPRRICECMWGLNPKIRLNSATATMIEKERLAGELHFGIATYKYGTSEAWGSHVDCYVAAPKIWIDGDLVFDRGDFTVLQDPEVRELAAKFGDPDEILRPGQPWDAMAC